MKKIKIVISLVIVILIISFVVCHKTGQQRIVQGSIKIGAILPLTGDLGEYGTDELRAINLFLRKYDLNKKIELLVEDSQTDSKTAVSALNKILLSNPKLILTLGSSISLAIQPIVNLQKISTITVAGNPETAKGYMIQNLTTSYDYVNLINQELKNKNVKRLGVIYRKDDIGVSVVNEINFIGEKDEEAVNPGESDFRTVITKIKSFEPDAIFVMETGKPLGILIKQIRTLIGDVDIYSTLEINYPEVKEIAGEKYYNIFYTDLNIDDNLLQIKEFKKMYSEEYKTIPSLDSILAYNEMFLVKKCILSESDLSLKDCLERTSFEGLTGKLKVENNRINYSDSVVLKKIMK